MLAFDEGSFDLSAAHNSSLKSSLEKLKGVGECAKNMRCGEEGWYIRTPS